MSRSKRIVISLLCLAAATFPPLPGIKVVVNRMVRGPQYRVRKNKRAENNRAKMLLRNNRGSGKRKQ